MAATILGVQVDLTSNVDAIGQVLGWAKYGESHYVCIANVHMVMEAYDSVDYRNIINSADLVTPDGMPLVWMMRAKGYRNQERVYGPTIMLQVLEVAAHENVRVGFYGTTPDLLDSLTKRMRMRYEGLSIAYSYSPAFGVMSAEEDAAVVKQINQSGARILFVGLGCPKQEIWMAAHRGKVNAVMVGVGAAFDFHAGVKPQAPAWMQKVGLEWLFRLFIEPRRLWRRYLYHNPRFIVLAVADLLGLLKD